jgi:hypothetical protein
MRVQKFRTIEQMESAPLVGSAGEGFEEAQAALEQVGDESARRASPKF